MCFVYAHENAVEKSFEPPTQLNPHKLMLPTTPFYAIIDYSYPHLLANSQVFVK